MSTESIIAKIEACLDEQAVLKFQKKIRQTKFDYTSIQVEFSDCTVWHILIDCLNESKVELLSKNTLSGITFLLEEILNQGNDTNITGLATCFLEDLHRIENSHLIAEYFRSKTKKLWLKMNSDFYS